MAFLNKQGLEHLWDNIIYKLSEKADKEYVDNAVANAGGGGGAPSDWNENDETSPAYVKNRTHYTELNTQLLLEETQVQATSLDATVGNAGIRASWVDIGMLAIDIHNTYIVTFDNTEYRVNPYTAPDGAYYIGQDLLTEAPEVEIPFVVGYHPTYNQTMGIVFDTEVHTIKIESEEQIVHKLDAKYIPNDVQGDWNQSDISALSYIKNKPFGLSLGKMLGVCCDVTVLAEELSEYAPGVYKTSGYTQVGNFDLGDFTYEVIIDGVFYYTQAVDGYSRYDYLGSLDFLSNPNESEFPFLIYKDGSGYLLMYLANEGPHTVKIIAYEGGYEFKQLDEKFIPDTIARKSDVAGNEATDEEVINLIAQRNIAVPVTDETNCVYTDENEKILVI